MKYVILTGDPADGFAVTGPFETVDEASHYLDFDLHGEDAWIVELHAPALPKGVTDYSDILSEFPEVTLTRKKET